MLDVHRSQGSTGLLPVAVLQLALRDFSVSVVPSVQFYARTAVAFAAAWAFLLCACLQVGKPVALAASTFLALPLLKQLGTVLDCPRDQASGAWTLDAAPEEIGCWHGAHLVLGVCAAATLKLYLPLLIPFTAAEGYLSIVPTRVSLVLSEWTRRKKDKATGINLHAMQPRAEGAFENSTGDLLGQVWAFLLCADLQVGKPVALAASTFLALPLLKQLCTVLGRPGGLLRRPDLRGARRRGEAAHRGGPSRGGRRRRRRR